MNIGLEELIKKVPDRIERFEGSEYPQPIIIALSGEIPDVSELKEKAKSLTRINLAEEGPPPKEKEIESVLYCSLSLAEIIEASRQDKKDYFISDAKFRGQVFGVKRSPGWALVLGDADQTELITRLREKRFVVFSTFQHSQANFLGNRETSSIYFLQNQVRYAMIYGRIEPGDPHEMAHFLEDEGPAILIVNGNQSTVESLLTLGYMLMGTPAIVPSSFPHPYGNRYIIDSVDQILEECTRFPNLRIIEHEGSQIRLPDYCDPANLREEVIVERFWGGSKLSFLAVRRAEGEDGIEVIGKPDQHLGLIIELNYEGMNEVAAQFLEEIAATFPNYIKGVTSSIFPKHNRGRTAGSGSSLRLGLAKDIKVSGEMIAQAIHDGFKKQYPKLGQLKVTVIFDEDLLREKKPEIDRYKAARDKVISSTNEQTMKEFYSCVGCQPFAREHACVVTPERPPQCGRDWRLMLVGAYLNPEDTPDPLSRKKKKISANAFGVLQKGSLIDSQKGEWTGVNEGICRESGGKITRVQIHSIRGGYPHSSCGCFGYLVFDMPKTDGIGIMKRGFKGKAPNGMTWDLLANRAGGKQEPGICGVSLNYLRSAKFLQGDGGYRRVQWMDQKTRSELADVLSNGDSQ